MVGYHHGKLNVSPSNYQFPLITCYQLIVNWLIDSVSEHVTPFWTFGSKEVKHIKNRIRTWNIIKCFMPEDKTLAIEKVFWKVKIKDWGYMSLIDV